MERRRYQRGSVHDDKDRWVIRWRADVKFPKGTILQNGDRLILTGEVIKGLKRGEKVASPSDLIRRVRRWDVLSKKKFPTKRFAQRELDRIIAQSNGGHPATVSVSNPIEIPPGLSRIDVELCDLCRERLIAAVQANQRRMQLD